MTSSNKEELIRTLDNIEAWWMVSHNSSSEITSIATVHTIIIPVVGTQVRLIATIIIILVGTQVQIINGLMVVAEAGVILLIIMEIIMAATATNKGILAISAILLNCFVSLPLPLLLL
jgi:hypothetical protein